MTDFKYEVRFFRFRRTEQIDSVIKGLMGAMLPHRIFGLEPLLPIIMWNIRQLLLILATLPVTTA